MGFCVYCMSVDVGFIIRTNVLTPKYLHLYLQWKCLLSQQFYYKGHRITATHWKYNPVCAHQQLSTVPALRKDTDRSCLAHSPVHTASKRAILEASAVSISTGKKGTDGDSSFKWLEGQRLEYKLDLKKLDWYKLNAVATVECCAWAVVLLESRCRVCGWWG